MLLTTTTTKTERLTAAIAAQLKKCDRIKTFKEGGWFFAYGWIGTKLAVKAHADSSKEYNNLMNPSQAWQTT